MKVYSSAGVVAQINGIDIESNDWTISTKFMDEDRVTLSVKLNIDQDVYSQGITFDKSWFVEVKDNEEDESGTRYTLISAAPSSSKSGSSKETTYTLIFGGADTELKTRIFREVATIGDTLGYSSTVAFVGTIDDFLDRLELNLKSAFGLTVYVDGAWECKYKIVRSYGNISFSQSDYVSVSFSDYKIWEVLLLTNDLYGYEWLSYTDGDQIVFDFDTVVGDTLLHEFTYRGDKNYDLSSKTSIDAIQGGISSISVTDKMEDVKTRLISTGGTTNIPLNHYILSDYNYLRDYETAEKVTYLRNLMPRVYRCYVMGFNDQRYYLAKDPNSDDVINDNEAYPKVMDLENRFSYHEAADDIASGNITIDTFEAWYLNYKNVWNKPSEDDSAQYYLLNLDDDWYALDDKSVDDWTDLTTQPYGFKAYLKGWSDRAKGGDVPSVNFDPVYYVDSIHQADYGVIEQVNEADETIYPALSDDLNDIIAAEEVETSGVSAVIPTSAFPQNLDAISHSAMLSNYAYREEDVSSGYDSDDAIEMMVDVIESKYNVTVLNYPNSTSTYNGIFIKKMEVKYLYSGVSMNNITDSVNIQKDGAFNIIAGQVNFTLTISTTRSCVGLNIKAYLLYVTNGEETLREQIDFGDDTIESPYVFAKSQSLSSTIPIETQADEYRLEYSISSAQDAISYPSYYVYYKASDGYHTGYRQEYPSANIDIYGIIYRRDEYESDNTTFDIWIKDIGFNIAEINKNEYSLTVEFDSFYNLYKDVVDGETDPPDGFTEEEYLTQILSYLESLSTYLSDIGLTYGWEQIKAGVEGTDDVNAFIVRPEEYETDAEYITYLDAKISNTSGDIATGSSGSSNLYKYFGTSDPVVKFTTGDLSGEYEYALATVGGEPQVFEDTSKYRVTGYDDDGNEIIEYSKYRLTLMRNSDDYDATGLYLPGGARQAQGGDKFQLINIELPFTYLYDGENRQETYMREQLAEIDTHQPDVAIEIDDIFLTKVLGDSRHRDYGKFKAGAIINVKSPLIDVYNDLGVKTDTYTVRINSYTKTSSETKISQT